MQWIIITDANAFFQKHVNLYQQEKLLLPSIQKNSKSETYPHPNIFHEPYQTNAWTKITICKIVMQNSILMAYYYKKNCQHNIWYSLETYVQ